MTEEFTESEPFEIRRRTGLYVLLTLVSLALAAAFAWLAYDRGQPILAIPAVLLVVVAVFHACGLTDPRAPLLVADDHGVRMKSDSGWVGLLWSELAEIKVEPRDGLRHDPRVKVVSSDGRRFYTSPLGLATNVSPADAAVQLAQRRSAAAY